MVDSVTSFYGLRFLLGAGEAGFFPGIIYYLTLWFPNSRRTQTFSWFLLAIPVAGVFSSLLSGWIMTVFDDQFGLHGWQWLFIIQGIPAVLLGFVSYFLLADSPAKASWLSATEKALLIANIEPKTAHQVSLREIVTSPGLWQLWIIYFLLVCELYGISFWLPQMVRDFGSTDFIMTGLLTAVPYAFAIIGMILMGKHSDKTQERRWHLISCVAGTGIGFILTVFFEHALLPSLASLSLATLSILSSIVIFWSIPTALLSGRLAAGGIALINAIGNLGGYVSPALVGWLKDVTQQMETGLLFLALTQGLAILLIRRLQL